MTKIALIILALNGGPAHSDIVGKHHAWDYHRTTAQREFAEGVKREWEQQVDEESGCTTDSDCEGVD